MSRIDDFGEKIHGARKDAHQEWVDRMSGVNQDGISVTDSLTKIWPEPNYSRMNLPQSVVSWVRAARDDLGPKPGRYQVHRWCERAKFLLGIVNNLIHHDWDEDVSIEQVEQFIFNQFDADVRLALELASSPIRRNIGAISSRALLYNDLGHKNSLRLLEFTQTQRDGEPVFYITVKENARTRARYYVGDSWEKAIEACKEDPFIKKAQSGEKIPVQQKKKVDLSIIRYSTRPGSYIAVKHYSDWIKLAKFADTQSAREALYKDYDSYVARFEAWKKAPPLRARENLERDGSYWRDTDISPEMFMEAFGFRGVQFGNYVENDRRQQDLNDAYDAFMDMAYALDVAPGALSLDGTLGLAFGARGRGGREAPNAHFEPAHQVINLTKSRGAGSLAHEWFHALDNYVGQALGAQGYLTSVIHTGQPVALNNRVKDHEALTEAIAGFRSIINIMKPRSMELDRKRSGKPYWSLNVEIGARSFEAAVKHLLEQKGARNDYLVNIVSEDTWGALQDNTATQDDESDLNAPCYPYPLKSEQEKNAQHMLTFVEGMRSQIDVLMDRFDVLDANDRPAYRPAQQA